MIHFVLFIVIGIAFITDARKSMIPNRLTVCGTLVGIMFHSVNEGWSGFLFAFTGAAVGFIALLFLYMIGALGAGDVKLFTSIGAIMGMAFVIQAMFYALIFAGVIGLILLLVRKQMMTTGHRLTNWFICLLASRDLDSFLHIKQQKNLKFPFMYAVLPGACMAWYYSFLG
ncbi:prepilin peptidase [Paenibacillus sp. N3.4]|uniref:A24 family peptidase n=1 Tax=Paenibacillus sp. N3.4 TaxID=2603222 RepID=UPI0011CB2488|nr:A24 family peptidase [Paenibacillus sp. N3.4]TXK85411.1 prepilin peptidase [Paenibacillus sp. N3.4]